VSDFEQAIVQAVQARCVQDLTAEQQALEDAVKLYQGDLLPSCYDDWICGERDRLQQIFLEALERLIELLEQERNYPGAIRLAQRLLRHDSLHEATYCRLMRLHAARGDRGGILRTYQTCVAVLKRDLAIEPCLKTKKIYKQLIYNK
jgi:DNA-binding SARP family transcriptional activator